MTYFFLSARSRLIISVEAFYLNGHAGPSSLIATRTRLGRLRVLSTSKRINLFLCTRSAKGEAEAMVGSRRIETWLILIIELSADLHLRFRSPIKSALHSLLTPSQLLSIRMGSVDSTQSLKGKY